MEPIRVSFPLTYDTALKGGRAFKRTLRRSFQGMGLLLTLLGLAVGMMDGRWGATALFTLGYGLLVLALPELVQRWTLRRNRHLIGHEVTLVLSDAGLEMISALGTSTLTWTAFQRAQRRAGFWIFQLSSQQAVTLPCEVLSASEDQALLELMRRAGLWKG